MAGWVCNEEVYQEKFSRLVNNLRFTHILNMEILWFFETLPDIIIPWLEWSNYIVYIIWRQLFHLLWSLILIELFSNIWRKNLFQIFFVIFFLRIMYQEFILHPETHSQQTWKWILDLIVRIMPLSLYFYFISTKNKKRS